MQTKKKKESTKGRAIYHKSALKKNAVPTKKNSQKNVRHIDKLKSLSEINNEGKKSILKKGIEKVKEIANFLNKTANKNSMRGKKNSNRDNNRGTVLRFNEPNRNKSFTDKEKKEHNYGRGPSKEDTHPRGRTTNTKVTHNRSGRTNERKVSSIGNFLLQDDVREEESLSALLEGLSKGRIGSSEEEEQSSEEVESSEVVSSEVESSEIVSSEIVSSEIVSSEEEAISSENALDSKGSMRNSRGTPSSGERSTKGHPGQAKTEDQKGAKSDNSAKIGKIGKIGKNMTKEEKVKEANVAHSKKHDGSPKNKNKKDHIVIDDSNIYIVIDDLNENLNDKNAIINKLNITNDTYNFLVNSKNEMRREKRRNGSYSFMGDSHPVSDWGVDVESLEGIDVDAEEEEDFSDEGDDDDVEEVDYNNGNDDDSYDDDDDKSVSIRGIGEDSTNDEVEDLEFNEIYESLKMETEYLHALEESKEEEALPEGEQVGDNIEVTSKKEDKTDQVDQMKDEKHDKGAINYQVDVPQLKESKPAASDNPEEDAPLVNKGNIEMNDEGCRKSDEESISNPFEGKRKNCIMEWKEVQPKWEEALLEDKSDQVGEHWSEASVIPIIPVVPVLPVMPLEEGLEELRNLQEIHDLRELEEMSEQEEAEAESRKRRKKMDDKGKREKLKFNNQKERRSSKSDELDRLYKQINKKGTNIQGEVLEEVSDEEDELNSAQYSKIVKLISISKNFSKYNMSIDLTEDDEGVELSNVGYTFKERGKNLDNAGKNRSKEKTVLLPLRIEGLEVSPIDKREIKKTSLKDMKRRDESEQRKEEKKTKLKRKYSNEGVGSDLKTGKQGSHKNANLKEPTQGKEEDLKSGVHRKVGEPSKGAGTPSSKRKNVQEGEEENVTKKIKKDEGMDTAAEGNEEVEERAGEGAPMSEQQNVSEEPSIVGEKGEKEEEKAQTGEAKSDHAEDVGMKEEAESFGDMAEEDAEVNAVLKKLIEQGTGAGEEEEVTVEGAELEEKEVFEEVMEKGEENEDGVVEKKGDVNIDGKGNGIEEEKTESDKFQEVAEEVYEELEEATKEEEYKEVEEAEDVDEVEAVDELDEVKEQESQKDIYTEGVVNKEDVPATEGMHSDEESDPQEKEDKSKLSESANEILVEESSKQYEVPNNHSNDNRSTNSDYTDLNVSSRKVSYKDAEGYELDKESSLKTLEAFSGGERLEMGTEECDENPSMLGKP
ncbi:Uncharacterized protein PCOAH_00025810 [Plasmodium coatneyi]|uniref:Uncharacterized protein n=1 Tax=Plasmodium coatneyi TaxID=208452 RepID=A0A1B1E0A5_9APIC|nr:Uncharacterized protein PCOAH_00025810 [Plasmodium coatneyi]ANQ08466.1 Uncharacterized protein PCOAH_00025810 [Plasmodium coatneyi]